MEALNKAFAHLTSTVTSNPYITTALVVFGLIFASLAAPNMHPALIGLFDNNLFKIFYLAIVLILFKYNVVLALVGALGYILAHHTLQKYRVFSHVQDHLMHAREAVTNFVGDAREITQNVVQGPRQILANVGESIASVPRQFMSEFLTNVPSAFSTANNNNIPVSCQNACGGQPLVDLVLPPTENTIVSGLCGCDSEGPQGLRFPPGYENLGMGYSITNTSA